MAWDGLNPDVPPIANSMNTMWYISFLQVSAPPVGSRVSWGWVLGTR